MKKLFFLIGAVLLCANLFGQMPPINWQKCYGGPGDETGNFIVRTKDGGYIMTGFTDSVGGQVTSTHGAADVWVVKTDSLGIIKWQKTYGGSGDDYGHGIQATTDGGYILGCIGGSGDGQQTGNHGQQDYWIVKLDSLGNITWEKSYGGPAADQLESIQLTRDGGYICAGTTWGTGGNVSGVMGQTDIWVIKLDSLGNLKWQKCLGGTNYDFGTCARQTPDNGYVVTGYTYSGDGDVTINYGSFDAFVAKLDSNGNLTWAHNYGGSGPDEANWPEPTPDGGYIVAGGLSSANGDGLVRANHHGTANSNDDIWVLKLSSTGAIQWQQAYGGSNNDVPFYIHQTMEGGYIVSGFTDSYDGDVKHPKNTNGRDEEWVIKIDAVGNLEWERAMGGADTAIYDASQANNIVQNPDSSFTVVGFTNGIDGDITGNHGLTDISVFKLAKTPPPCLQFAINNTNFDCHRLTDTTTLVLSHGIADSICWGDGTSSAYPGFTNSHVYAQPGIYNITIADSTGCLKTAEDTVINLGITIDTVLFINPSCDYTIMGEITITATGGQSPYSYLWSNGATTTAIHNLSAGYYSITVTDPTGCTSIMRYNLYKNNNNPGYYVYCPIGEPNCGNNGLVSTEVHNGLPPFKYLWSNSATTASITGLGQGYYNVTVTDSLGCQVSGQSMLTPYCYNFIYGTVFNDTNSNCVQDAGEEGLPGTVVVATDNNGNSYYGNVWSTDGHYTIEVPDTGTFTISAVLNHYSPCGTLQFCGNSTTVYFQHMNDTSFNNNYGVHFSGYDLQIYAGWGTVPPCYTHGIWEKWYWLTIFNNSAVPVPGPATVTFKFDPALSYIGYESSPSTSYDAATHTLTYQIDTIVNAGLPTYMRGNIVFQYLVYDPGYQLRSEFWITPTAGDCDTGNNHLLVIDSIFDSHDPNEKTVEPVNNIAEEDSVLTYTINFQNTGNDTAWFITVVDTLSSSLDPTTVRNIASSIPIT